MMKTSTPAPRRVRKSLQPTRRFTQKSVLKMLAVMSEQSPDSTRDITQDFLTTGRAGRRNALPDILSEHAHVSTSDLPDRLQNLSTSDTVMQEDDKVDGSSGSQVGQSHTNKPCASTSKSERDS
uniref:Uncharacterized protein n=1 Tax=Clastoptera arizonana TaxID=38151 RepID=A0A1B6DIZ2_9HEMI